MTDASETAGARAGGNGSAPQLPLFYKSLTPLDPEKHAKLRKTAGANYGFARQSNLSPLLAVEFVQAQKHYPIVFAQNEPHLPMALFGFEQGKNPFVDEQGNWQRGKYIPAYLRRYPFSLVPTTREGSQLALCLDETSGLLEEAAEGDLFSGGELSETGQKIMSFCQEFHRHLLATQELGKLLGKMGLLQASSIRVQAAGKSTELKGFLVVNEQRLTQLSDEDYLQLRPRGLIGVVYAHLMSLGSAQSVAMANRGMPELG